MNTSKLGSHEANLGSSNASFELLNPLLQDFNPPRSNPSSNHGAESLMGFPHLVQQMGSLEFAIQVSSSSHSSCKPVEKRHKPYRFGSQTMTPLFAQYYEELHAGLGKRKLVTVKEAEQSSALLRTPGFQLQKQNNKTRIRWTPDLHEKFIKCVDCLGGAEKATPKAILKLMDSDELTVYHIKSHLQKYRNAKCLPEPSQECLYSSMQITETLQIQLELQRHLHEQLEIQRNLQIRIEEQSRQLEKIFKEQTKSEGNNIIEVQHMPFSMEQ
ncbi:hypothetical protein HPP92_023781 [Vanilla planifolia]|uniref:HTH myb-type domain-containing protein n=1 Tax=Vanilla planifolia TaxID=51239 RepID=A0A835PJP4_VANPL|nr:hypothetical protein HPP92_023781 [Vanilla planifolia]